MQRKDAQKLSELLPQILADQQLDRRLDETQAAGFVERDFRRSGCPLYDAGICQGGSVVCLFIFGCFAQ